MTQPPFTGKSTFTSTPDPAAEGSQPAAGPVNPEPTETAPGTPTPEPTAGSAGVGDLVEYAWSDADDHEHTRLGLVVEVLAQPDDDGNEVELARVVELPDAVALPLDALTRR